jgi:uncharacterized protein (TIGR00297 family)
MTELSPYAWFGVVVGLAALTIAGLRRWLTPSGIAAGFVTGAALVVGSHAAGPILLALFFISSSLLDRVGRRRRDSHGASAPGREPRTAGQVLANAAIPSVAALLAPFGYLPQAGAALAGALAAMTADTWATEVGAGLRAPARLITSLRPVEAGESGGVSLPGTVAGFAGASAIALAAVALPDAAWGPAAAPAFLPVIAGGVAGLLADSLLGATAERRWPAVNNESVNLLASLTGAVVAVLMTAAPG